MASRYYAVLTDAGAELEARALKTGKGVVLTHIAIGDANLSEVTPDPAVTKLVHEVHRRPIDSRSQDGNDPKVTLLHATIPADVGGWWIYELGVIGHLEGEEEEVLYAYANHGRYYKVLPQDGQTITHELTIPIIQSTDAELTIELPDEGYVTRGDFLNLKAQVESLHTITRATWNLSAAVKENGAVTLPASLAYEVGSKSLRLYYLGLLLAPSEQYEEVGSTGESSKSIKLLFSADKGDEFQLIIKN